MSSLAKPSTVAWSAAGSIGLRAGVDAPIAAPDAHAATTAAPMILLIIIPSLAKSIGGNCRKRGRLSLIAVTTAKEHQRKYGPATGRPVPVWSPTVWGGRLSGRGRAAGAGA